MACKCDKSDGQEREEKQEYFGRELSTILFHFCWNHNFCPSVSNSQWDITFIGLCRNSPRTIRCSSASSGDWINNANPPKGDARSKSKQEWNEWVDSCGNWTLTCGNNNEISFPIDSWNDKSNVSYFCNKTQTLLTQVLRIINLDTNF